MSRQSLCAKAIEKAFFLKTYYCFFVNWYYSSVVKINKKALASLYYMQVIEIQTHRIQPLLWTVVYLSLMVRVVEPSVAECILILLIRSGVNKQNEKSNCIDISKYKGTVCARGWYLSNRIFSNVKKGNRKSCSQEYENLFKYSWYNPKFHPKYVNFT